MKKKYTVECVLIHYTKQIFSVYVIDMKRERFQSFSFQLIIFKLDHAHRECTLFKHKWSEAIHANKSTFKEL